MDDRLKPCPFCGGEAEVNVIDYDETDLDMDSTWWVQCRECGALTDEYSGGDEAEAAAIKAWNKRAERWNERHERTCRDANRGVYHGFVCSECGASDHALDKPSYCRSCGAKVVE